MGVQGLWELLSPVGRRVSVETLAGKKLAIDASIWMVQFMKAMRDDRGEMVRNAHLIGFFRRICKLLFLKTKPVFVFDGGTPALKRRTVIARRRQRENAQAKIRKTAEKLLLNQIKQMRLKELAKDLENQRKNQKRDVKGKGKAKLDSGNQGNVESGGANNEMSGRSSAGKDGSLNNTESTSAAEDPSAEDNGDDDEDIVLAEAEMNGVVDPDVFAALPPSIQRKILAQKNDSKGKKKLVGEMDQLDSEGRTSEPNTAASASYNQEKLDQMLAASLMAEEDGKLTNNTSTSATAIPFEEDADEDEEMIFPAMHGNIDPAVLASLPPSMQLDLLVQMRERLMAENRQKYQKVKKAPEKFSELQIQSYLKTVAFRREINEVQKAAAGTGVGGIQTSRIASEANREFIFSSSFTGDRQELTSARPAASGDMQQQMPPKLATEALHKFVSGNKSKNVAASVPNESGSTLDEDIQTYVDERGRVRLNKSRAMGVRMTRDLERNLDLMKEIEQERTHSDTVNVDSLLDKDRMGTRGSTSEKNQLQEPSHNCNSEAAKSNGINMQSIFDNKASMEISFEDGAEKNDLDADDEIFARLVAGDLVTTVVSPEKSPLRTQSSDSGSDLEWEEDVNLGNCGSANDVNVEAEPSIKEGHISDGSEVEWEDASSSAPKTSSGTSEQVKTLSKGSMQEEADLQEAIRRSFMESSCKESNYFLSGQKPEDFEENEVDGTEILCEEDKIDGRSLLRVNDPQQNESQSESADGIEKLCGSGGASILVKCTLPEDQLKSGLVNHLDNEVEKNIPLEQYNDCHNEGGQSSCIADKKSEDASNSLDAVVGALPETIPSDYKKNDQSAMISDTEPCPEMGSSIMIEERKNDYKSKLSYPSIEITDSSIPVSESTSDLCNEQKLSGEGIGDKYINEREQSIDESAFKVDDSEQVEFTEASFEEELLILGEEQANLGHEQRKLERNAEGVSSEMFAECQELLQMFGLPYIIAPMEAEAQCAHMELANLVDGVVTDDSDVFLFGAQSVYKNIFDDRKYVETYFMKDMEKELGLTREKLIRMALLLGSDYTEGISGIGIVNAIEVVNAFPEEDGLLKFREWIESPDPSILGTINVQGGSTKRKRGKEADGSRQLGENMDATKQIFMDKHRNVSKNWHVPPSFPSEAVIMAYFSPQVDKSTEPFTWGKPDLSVLRKLCWEKFGWGGKKSDELLVPVLKEYEKREIQLRLEAFYSFNERFAKIRSKRINKAVKGITGKQNPELTDDVVQKASTSRKRVKDGTVNSSNKKTRKPSAKSSDTISGNQSKSEDVMPEQSGDGQNTAKPFQSEIINAETPLQPDGGQKTRKQSRGAGRGRGRRVQRGRGKANLVLERPDSSHSDDSSDTNELEVHCDMLEQGQDVRRSARSRNKVNYAMSDPETDEVGISPNTKGNSGREAMEHDSFVGEKVHGDAVAGSLADEIYHQVPDSTPVGGFSSEYLEKGGGFCADEDEAEASHPGTNSYVEPEDPLYKEYLNTGGGFCVDEDETTKDQEASYHPDILGKSDSPDSLSFIKVADHDINPMETSSSPKRASERLQNKEKTAKFVSMSNVESEQKASDTKLDKGALPEDSETEKRMPFSGALSAMPNLKKKRRKN